MLTIIRGITGSGKTKKAVELVSEDVQLGKNVLYFTQLTTEFVNKKNVTVLDVTKYSTKTVISGIYSVFAKMCVADILIDDADLITGMEDSAERVAFLDVLSSMSMYYKVPTFVVSSNPKVMEGLPITNGIRAISCGGQRLKLELPKDRKQTANSVVIQGQNVPKEYMDTARAMLAAGGVDADSCMSAGCETGVIENAPGCFNVFKQSIVVEKVQFKLTVDSLGRILYYSEPYSVTPENFPSSLSGAFVGAKFITLPKGCAEELYKYMEQKVTESGKTDAELFGNTLGLSFERLVDRVDGLRYKRKSKQEQDLRPEEEAVADKLPLRMIIHGTEFKLTVDPYGCYIYYSACGLVAALDDSKAYVNAPFVTLEKVDADVLLEYFFDIHAHHNDFNEDVTAAFDALRVRMRGKLLIEK